MVKAKQICPPPCLRIDLGRESARTPYVLSLVEEETILNPALQANLFNDFNIKLPEIPVDKLAMAFHAGPNPMLGLGFVVASLVLGHMKTIGDFYKTGDKRRHVGEYAYTPRSSSKCKICENLTYR